MCLDVRGFPGSGGADKAQQPSQCRLLRHSISSAATSGGASLVLIRENSLKSSLGSYWPHLPSVAIQHRRAGNLQPCWLDWLDWLGLDVSPTVCWADVALQALRRASASMGQVSRQLCTPWHHAIGMVLLQLRNRVASGLDAAFAMAVGAWLGIRLLFKD